MPTVIECALMARDVYNNGDRGAAASPEGWFRSNLPPNWLSGFYGAVFTRNEQTVIAFRGTDFSLALRRRDPRDVTKETRTLFDTISDLLFGDLMLAEGSLFSSRHSQIHDAENALDQELTKRRTSQPTAGRTPPIIVTGHSLGGGLAQHAVHNKHARGVVGVTFNAPGIVRRPCPNEPCFNVQIEADPVNAFNSRSVAKLFGRHTVGVDELIDPSSVRGPSHRTPSIQLKHHRITQTIRLLNTSQQALARREVADLFSDDQGSAAIRPTAVVPTTTLAKPCPIEQSVSGMWNGVSSHAELPETFAS
jgi:hypothetical protein